MKISVVDRKNILLLIQEKECIAVDSKIEFFFEYKEMIDYLANLNQKNKNIFLHIYQNKENIHEILYNSEEIIDINSFKINNTINELFYLNLLIVDNPEVVNYSYSIEFIKNLKEMVIKSDDKNAILKIAYIKFIIDLIKNYEGLDAYNEKNDKPIFNELTNEITNEMMRIKKDNLIVFDKNFNMDDILDKKIDEFYITIISSLIKSKKFDDYDYINNIMNQLCLEKIYLTQFMKEELIKCIDVKNDYIKEYIIEKKEDFLRENKTNFYYILLKYIFKNPIYIYQIKILLEAKKLILKLIKNDELLNYNDIINDKMKIKIKYIIETLLDSKYYIVPKKINKKDLLNLEEIKLYYKHYLFESKKKEINEIEDIIKNKKGEYKNYLKDLEFAEKMNKRYPIIYYFYKEKNKNKEIIKEDEFQKIIKSWNQLENSINNRKIKKMRKDDKQIIYNYFTEKNNEKILLDIFEQNIIDFIINEFKNIFDNEKINEKNKEEKVEKNSIKKEKEIKNQIEESNNPQLSFIQNKNIENNQNKNNKEKEGKIMKILINESNNSNLRINMSTGDKSSKITGDSGTLAFLNKDSDAQLSSIQSKNVGNNQNQNNKQNENEGKIVKTLINESINSNSRINMSTANQSNNINRDSGSLTFLKVDSDIQFIVVRMLSNSSFKFHMNERKYINIDEIKYGEKEKETTISNEQFEKNFRNIKDIKCPEIKEKAKKFYGFIIEFKERLINEFKYNYKLRINIYLKKEKSNNDDDNLDNITCKYYFYDPINNKEFCFIDTNVLKYGTNSLENGFEFLIDKINSQDYEDVKYKEYIENISKNKKTDKNIYVKEKENKVNNNIKSNDNNEILNNIIMNNSNRKQTCIIAPEIRKVAEEDNVLEIIKILDKDNKYNGFFLELKNGYYLTCKNDNSINIYQSYFNLVWNIKQFNEPIFNIYERINNNNKNNNISEIIICTKNNIYLLTIDLKELKTSQKVDNFKDKTFLNCVEIKESYYIALGFSGVFGYSNLFMDRNDISPKEISNEGYFNYIKINDNLLVLVSNRIIPGGKDKISIYNNNSKKISYSYEGYSFILSPNGLSLFGKREIEFNENNDRKKKKNKNKNKKKRINNNILLCACKKYYNDQKNGILIINGDIHDYNNTYKNFFDTDSFEVNCFCPIKKVYNKNADFDNINKEYKNNITITETDYFFVGGFDLKKRKGKVKLFKLILNEGISDINIEFLQDIEFLDNDDFNEFDSAINSITQSNISGNIIISCYDEKIYLFTQPNIDYYLEN